MLAHVSKKIRKSKQKSRKLEKSERKPFWTLAVTSQCRTKEKGKRGDRWVPWATHRWHLASLGGDVLCYTLA
jgi:hypothetical protein